MISEVAALVLLSLVSMTSAFPNPNPNVPPPNFPPQSPQPMDQTTMLMMVMMMQKVSVLRNSKVYEANNYVYRTAPWTTCCP